MMTKLKLTYCVMLGKDSAFVSVSGIYFKERSCWRQYL